MCYDSRSIETSGDFELMKLFVVDYVYPENPELHKKTEVFTLMCARPSRKAAEMTCRELAGDKKINIKSIKNHDLYYSGEDEDEDLES